MTDDKKPEPRHYHCVIEPGDVVAVTLPTSEHSDARFRDAVAIEATTATGVYLTPKDAFEFAHDIFRAATARDRSLLGLVSDDFAQVFSPERVPWIVDQVPTWVRDLLRDALCELDDDKHAGVSPELIDRLHVAVSGRRRGAKP